jgi:hypothetical protein
MAQPVHSGGNDRFCARLKTDISAFSSGLQGHLRSCLTILNSSRRPLSKNVRHDLVRPLRPELEAEMTVFNLAQKRSFPPLCSAHSIIISSTVPTSSYPVGTPTRNSSNRRTLMFSINKSLSFIWSAIPSAFFFSLSSNSEQL